MSKVLKVLLIVVLILATLAAIAYWKGSAILSWIDGQKTDQTVTEEAPVASIDDGNSTPILSVPPTPAPVAPAPTPAPTAELPFTGDPRSACPVASTGTNPVTGEPLMMMINPYGDYHTTGVVCEFEIIGLQGGTTVRIPNGMAALIADWAITCPTGSFCEGTWVATDDFILPAGWLAHVYLYTGIDAAVARFLGNQATGEGSFACEYVNGHEGHSVDNIRIPSFWSTWEDADGSIFDHAQICPAR